MCAERVALYNLSIQHPAKQIHKMAVVARKEEEFVPATCCGACRQVMLEFEKRQKCSYEIIMLGADKKWIKCRSASVLIPFQFEF
jgi:cytidine deaminase